ncbi:MAG: hypothetical protein ABIH24_05335, partial [Verrucomicrobiota bacterium]
GKYWVRIERSFAYFTVSGLSTSIVKDISLYAKGTEVDPGSSWPKYPDANTFDDWGDRIGSGVFAWNTSSLNHTGAVFKVQVGDAELTKPEWVSEPPSGQAWNRGYWGLNAYAIMDWQFNYCTNKYW